MQSAAERGRCSAKANGAYNNDFSQSGTTDLKIALHCFITPQQQMELKLEGVSMISQMMAVESDLRSKIKGKISSSTYSI